MSDTIGCIKCHRKIAHIRGLCVTCYPVTMKAIKAGKTTEAAEMAAGTLLPRHRSRWHAGWRVAQ